MDLINHWEALLRLIIAAVLGGVIGYDRELQNKPAGIRTYMLVSMGSALFMLTTYVIIGQLEEEDIDGVRVSADASRIAAGVVAGIGFIGGGLILHSRERVTGLTTAAGIWATAAIGLMVGLGEFIIPIIAAFIILITLTGGRFFPPLNREDPPDDHLP